MVLENKILIVDLLSRARASLEKVNKFEHLSLEQLRYKNDDQWSILECLEHLNLYGDFYLVEIEKQIMTNQNKKAKVFRSGLLGNYFANLMEVKQGKIRKIKTPKDKNPKNLNLTVTTISRFIKQQEQLLFLLRKSKDLDLSKIKTSLSLTSLIKLRLGDTLRFYTYHIERHVLQAERVLDQQITHSTAMQQVDH